MTVAVQQQLLTCLKKIDRPGTFCTSGLLPATVPGLEVEGLGPVALPLGKREVASFKKQARQAPYGKGTETVVDTNVRRVWEIDADQVSLTNPQWLEVVEQAVGTAQSALGLEKQKLKAHLYKLLLYEKGSFFLPHRDGEKLERMVATLVIALPTQHEGGELIVRHEGREEVIEFGPQSQFQTQFVAFYADCEHEIRPVTSGFRLALVYNLTLAKSNRGIAAPTIGEHVVAIASHLKQWASERQAVANPAKDDAPSKLAVLLDHQYTQAGLTCDALKGIDRAKADIVFAAAREAGCDASLALVTYWASGAAEPSGDYYDRSHRRRRYYYDEDHEGYDDEDGGEHIMGELYDSSLSASGFRDADGELLGFGDIPLRQCEVVSNQDWNERTPDKEEFEGYTGNAGMTLERWYHRAAIVVWPATCRFDVLCEGGVETAVGGLEQMIKQWQRASKQAQPSLKEQCLEFARSIIANWPEQKYGKRYGGASDSHETVSLISLLPELEDPALISAYISRVLTADVCVDPGMELAAVCRKLGWRTFERELRDLFEQTTNESIERHARLLALFALQKDKNPDRKTLCVQLAERFMSAMERWNPHARERTWQARTVDLNELLPSLVHAFVVLDQPELLDRLVQYQLDRPQEFNLTTVQIPVLLKLQKWLSQHVKHPCPPLYRWLAAIHETLQTRAAEPPHEPPDWRREATHTCNCADCEALRRFLLDPTLAVLRLPLSQDRRQHLHQAIDGHKLDTTHVTQRTGRPYTLVCGKTKASYERALVAHQVDLGHLAAIRALLEWHDAL